MGFHSPAGAFCCGAEDVVVVSDEGVDVVLVGAVVAAGVFCTDVVAAEGAGLSSSAGAQGTDVVVGVVVLVGVVVAVVVVVTVEVTGSHESFCDGAPFPGESAGWAILAATGVVSRNNAAVEIAKARVSACLRRVKGGADFKAIRYPSSTGQSGAARIAWLWTCWIESPPAQRVWEMNRGLVVGGDRCSR